MLSDDAPLVIEVIGLPVFAHHGVREHEKRDGQRFVIDLRLEPESAAGCETDRLEHAVSYSEAARIAVDAASRRRYDLIERLAARDRRHVARPAAATARHGDRPQALSAPSTTLRRRRGSGNPHEF